MKYRKKPVVVEAIQWNGNNLAEIRAFVGKNVSANTFVESFTRKELGSYINIETLEGIMTASIGDYIIKGVQGEFYPYKPDIFLETYEMV